MTYKKFKTTTDGVGVYYYNNNGEIFYSKVLVRDINSKNTFIKHERFYKNNILFNYGKPSVISYYPTGNIKVITVTNKRGFRIKSTKIPNTIHFDEVGNITYQCFFNNERWYK